MKSHFKLFIFFSVLLSAFFVSAASVANSPTSCSGEWTNCANAFADNTNRATVTATGTANKTGMWQNYGFSVLDSATIDSVTIRADFFASRTSGFINVQVSNNGGVTYGPSHVVGGNTAEQTFLIDVTTDFAWTGSTLNNSNFKVNATCFKSGGGPNPTCRLDWIPVTVNSTPFDFSIGTSPASDTVVQAHEASTIVTVTLLGGISQLVTLSSTNCPPSATCTFDQSSGTPTFNTAFNVSTSASTPAGLYQINITGTGDNLTRTTLYTLNVTDSQPQASASAVPTSGIVPLDVNFTGNFIGGDGPFTFFWDFQDGSNSTLQNPQHIFTASGQYNASFTVTDFDGDSSIDYEFITVTDTFDFSMGVSPSSDSVDQGSQVTTVTTATLLGGISQLVSLSSTGCPPSATCSFSPSSGNPTFSSNFTVSTTTSTTAGTYNINVTGTGGGFNRTAVYTLTVNAVCVRNNPSVDVFPSSQNATAGTELNYTVFVTNLDTIVCGASNFSLSSVIPSNWSAFFENAVLQINPSGTGVTNFNITSANTATPGPYDFNVTATNDNAPTFSGTDSAIYNVI